MAPGRLPDGSIDFEYENDRDVDLVQGRIPEQERRVIHGILRDDLTQRDDDFRVIQSIWAGIGGLSIEEVTPSRVDQPDRDIVPFTGAFDEIALVDECHTASVVYLESDAWCLANDTDLVSTYLGCTSALARRFLDDPRLECVAVEPGHQLG